MIRECSCTFYDDGEVIVESSASALNSKGAACQAAYNKGQPDGDDWEFECR
jgi:hypothetical protein